MYNHFCRCYNNFISINEPSYRKDIALILEGLTDRQKFDDLIAKDDARAKELSHLIYLVSKHDHPRMKTLSYELEGYGFGTGNSSENLKQTGEQIKLIELLLTTHYYS